MGPGPIDGRFLKWAVQDPGELDAFCGFVTEEKVTSYLEVGAKYGGSLWRIANAMPIGSVIVAIDLPYGSTFKRPYSEPYLRDVVKELKQMGYRTHLVIGDSTDKKSIEIAQMHAPYDLCLIDANHTEHYVRSDWANYGPLAKIVAFHDIGWDMAKNHKNKIFPIDVPKVWNELKPGYRHREIKKCATRADNGFGILWRE